jgi:iron complex outermembrane receptor protein
MENTNPLITLLTIALFSHLSPSFGQQVDSTSNPRNLLSDTSVKKIELADTAKPNEIPVLQTPKPPKNFEFLEEVVISSNKKASKLKETVVGISVLKPYIFNNKITLNAITALSQVPGVVINDDQINIRSGSGWSYGAGSRVMVIVDDMPMLSGDAGIVPFNFLPTENIGSIEVIKSAGSVLYGSSALNGVVNMTTMPISNFAESKVFLNGGTYFVPDKWAISSKSRIKNGISGFYTEKIKNHALGINWNMLNDDGYRMSSHDYRMRMGWRYGYLPKKLPELQVWLNGTYQKGENGSFALWQNNERPYNTLDSGFSKNTAKRLAIDPILSWNGRRWKHKFQNRFLSIDNDIDNGNPRNNQDNKSKFFYSEWRSSTNIILGLNFTAGFVNTYTLSESPLYLGDHTSNNNAGFLQIQYKYKSWVFESGSRFERFRVDNKKTTKPVSRFGLNKQLTSSTSLRASYSEGFRYPSMAELFTLTPISPIVFVFPNLNLKPETSRNYEIGLKKGIQIGGIQSFIDVSAFYMNIKNLMEYTFGFWEYSKLVSGLGFMSLNVSSATIKGFEIESAGKWTKGKHQVKWLTGYTYSLPTIDNPDQSIGKKVNGEDITFANSSSDNTTFMKYRNRHVIRTDVQYDYQRLSFGLSHRYQSEFENIDLAFLQLQPIVNGVDIAFRSGKISAHIFDVRMGYQIDNNLKLNIQITNLTQQIYMGRPMDMSAPRAFQFQLVFDLVKDKSH